MTRERVSAASDDNHMLLVVAVARFGATHEWVRRSNLIASLIGAVIVA